MSNKALTLIAAQKYLKKMFAFLFVLKKNLCFMFSCLICKTIETAGLKSEQNSMSLPICLGT